MLAAFDEMKGADGTLRPAYNELFRWLSDIPSDALDYRRREAEVLFRRIGITFAVYGEADAQERLIPVSWSTMAGMRLFGLIFKNSGLNCSSLLMSTACAA